MNTKIVRKLKASCKTSGRAPKKMSFALGHEGFEFGWRDWAVIQVLLYLSRSSLSSIYPGGVLPIHIQQDIVTVVSRLFSFCNQRNPFFEVNLREKPAICGTFEVEVFGVRDYGGPTL